MREREQTKPPRLRCSRGHRLVPGNVVMKGGRRYCRTCRLLQRAESLENEARRAAVLAAFGFCSLGFCSASGCQDGPDAPPPPIGDSPQPVLPMGSTGDASSSTGEPQVCPWDGTCAALVIVDECPMWAVACGDGWRCVDTETEAGIVCAEPDGSTSSSSSTTADTSTSTGADVSTSSGSSDDSSGSSSTDTDTDTGSSSGGGSTDAG